VEQNDHRIDYPEAAGVHHFFEAQVERTPNAIAVVCKDRQLTYGELNRQANQLAHHLRSLGVGPEVKVGICVHRSVDMVMGILGILKAHGAYVPLDPAYPAERLSLMMQDTRVPVLLTQEPLLKELPEHEAHVVCLDTQWPSLSRRSEDNLRGTPSAANLAYVIYTSGSTGMPKGVMVTHGSLCHYIPALQAQLGVRSSDVYLHTASIAFSASVRQFILPLAQGATVVIAAAEERTNPLALFDLIKRRDVTIMDIVPSFWRACIHALARLEPRSRNELLDNRLRLILTSGEPLPAHVARDWRFELKHGAHLVNLYGLTETTGIVVVYPIPAKDDHRAKIVPLGCPIANTQAYLLDGNLKPVPPGESGELYVAGPRVARGYLNRPELTAETFIADPFSDEPGARLCKTGDLARYLPDGNIEFIGRLDHQVKIRGFRIELEEIEIVLSQHRLVREVAMGVREDGPGEMCLVAYFVPGREDGTPISELRGFLNQKLPAHMVPSVFVMLEALPRLPSGKVDRQALRAPEESRQGGERTFVAPRTPIEEGLAEILAQVLGLDRVGIHDDFFELGGHSLRGAEVVTEVRKAFQVDLPLESLLKTSTVAGLASEIEGRKNERTGDRYPGLQLPTITPAPEQRYQPFPLTDIQQAYWIGRAGFLELGYVSTHRYVEVESVDLDLERFSLAWQQLIDRHDMLRAVVLPDGQQQILKEVPPYEMEVLDLRGQDREGVEASLEAVRHRMSHQVLPSDRWPLFEIRASHLNHRRFRLHFSFDALILDIWSRSILFRDWAKFYKNPKAAVEPLELSFRDYVLAEETLRHSELYQRSQEYWFARLSTLPPSPELPLAKKPKVVTIPRFERHRAKLGPETWLRLKSRAAHTGLTPSGALLAAYAETLKVWSKNPRFTVNLTVFNRLPLHPRVNDIVGDFTSVTLLAVENSLQGTFKARALRLQQQLWNDVDHRYVSGVEVLREQAKRRGGTPRAEMPVVFTSGLTHDARRRDPNPMSWMGEVVYSITQTPQVWIDHQVFEESGALVFNWDAVAELFPDGMLEAMFDSYCLFLHRLADDEESWQETWPETAEKLVPPAQLEERTVVNATEASEPTGLLHTLFASQVPERPDQPAVVAPDRVLTYEELFFRSNQVGRRLRQLGARPNKLVAVVVEKGWEQVVAVLGILGSGAAYVPIEAGLPKERLWYLLEHGEVDLVLTQSSLNQSLEWPDGLQRVCLDDEALTGADNHPLDAVQGPEDLAYVIYTSGSTGLPKGVMIDHRGAVNTILDINKRFGVGQHDRVLALSALSFDLSVYDIFGTLAAGGTIVMPEQGAARDPSRWAQLIAQEGVTIWNSVPTLMALLVDYVANGPGLLASSLRLVLLSGDWIPLGLPDQIKAQLGEVQIISLGGATEASIWSILYPIETVDRNWKSIPYGRPMVNQRFHVLNEALAPCPLWVPGRLYIGGVGLAKGYWRDEEKTQRGFITHPRTGERLYRTGDLGRYLPDGNIEFLGREDFQVKIQGYRVELGEIESALGQHPGIRMVAAKAVGELQGDKRLVAYVVPEPKSAPGTSELRHFLQQKLPEYMIPSAFVLLDELPLTPNGKVDRDALPDPSKARWESLEPSVAEAPNLTARIGQLVASILGIAQIDPEADLLNLGATSVHMIRIANLLESELNFRPKIDELYRLPSVMGLARSYEKHLRQGRMPKEGVDASIERTPESVSASFPLIVDPEEREAFKNKQPGLRQGDGEKPRIELPMTNPDDTLKTKYAERRSYRQFSPHPISFARLSEFLGCLHQIKLDGKPKYLYGSAGGLYPVQTYLYIKPGRVEGLAAGIYYYHPLDHGLVLLSPRVDFDRGVYDPIINGPIFDEAAFGVFLIAQLSAISPMYGARSVHYATIEAGLMSQLLETSAPACGIGLCQIGNLDFKRIQDLFELDQSHVLVHSLLGGLIDIQTSEHWSPFREARGHESATLGEREEGEI
jgi:amino acid adenylation domain-containing protein